MTRRRLQLTDAGLALASTARGRLQAWASFQQEVDAVKGLSRGKLRVAVVSTAKYFMPRLIGSFCRKHPEIDVSLEILNRDGVVPRLRDHINDLSIMSMPPTDMELSDVVFLPNPIVVIPATSDPLSRRGPLALTDLSDSRFILCEKGSGTRMACDQHFRKMRFRPDVRLELGSNKAIKESVAGGLGVGVVSRHALHGHQKERGVAIIEVKDFPLPSARHIVHPSARKLSPVAAAFRQHLLREVARNKSTDSKV